MNLIYIGNKLHKQKGIMSVMETLSEQFESFAHVVSVSDKKSIICKLIDITTILLKNLKKSDCVLIDVFSTKAFFFALWASFLSRVYKKRFILNLHGGNLPNRYKSDKNIFGYMLRNAFAITAPSGYLVDFFKNAGYSVKLIPNPIKLDCYPKINSQTEIPIILYLRGYGKIYQPELAIEAMKHLVRSYRNAHLYMFGNNLDGGMEKCISLVNTYQLHNNITINGPQTKSVWIETAQKCNICISVPVIDNTPVSLLEAMVMGIPVITTNVGGLKWMIKNKQNGFLTDANPENLAHIIVQLIEDKQLYHHIQQNALTYIKTYDLPFVIQQWRTLLNEKFN